MQNILQILYTDNPLFGDKQTVSFDTSNTPTVSGRKTFTIVWAGDCLEMRYTRKSGSGGGVKYTQVKQSYYGGGSETITLWHNPMYGRISNEILYFIAHNVTSLEVNGETLI